MIVSSFIFSLILIAIGFVSAILWAKDREYMLHEKAFSILALSVSGALFIFGTLGILYSVDSENVALKRMETTVAECKAKIDLGEAENLMDCGLDATDYIVREAIFEYHKNVYQ